jgi:hypothetical protein
MRKSLMTKGILLMAFLLVCTPALAVDINLSGATTGTSIVAPGGSFAETFAGQTVNANGISLNGSPTNPLSLAASGTLLVESWDPVVSPASNSILPQPGNTAPLCVLLDTLASAVTWTMGSAQNSDPIEIDFYAGDGSLVHSVSQALTLGYAIYSFSGFGNFQGFSISENVDPAGLRYQNFSYTAVPIPGAVLLLGSGLFGLMGIRRFKKN